MPVLVASVFLAFKRAAAKLSWKGDPVRTPSQVIAPSAADTAGENVASRLADGMPPPHISASGKCISRF
jgi:hypothetical protein